MAQSAAVSLNLGTMPIHGIITRILHEFVWRPGTGHFGGWLRLIGSLPAGAALPVIVHLALKE